MAQVSSTAPLLQGALPRASLGVRRTVEIVLRSAALLLLLLLLWRQWPRAASADDTLDAQHLGVRDFAPDSTGQRTVAAVLDAVLRSGTRASAEESAPEWSPVELTVRTLPSRAARGALAAAAAAGVTVSWADSTRARGISIGAARTADPDGRVVVSASGARGPLVVRDNGGVLDSMTASANGARLLLRGGAAWFASDQSGSVARVAAPAPVVIKRLLVYARPGWESKFTLAALEESGWSPDASLPVSPRVSVTVGAPSSLDTARYAAAIVLDSGVAPVAPLMRFAQQGGGVIIAGAALRDARLLTLSPARVVGERGAIAGGLLSPNPRTGLPAVKLSASPDAMPLEREAGNVPATVVMRRGAGRVLASAYRESWQWRMEGGNGGASAHREWWSGLVRAVAYAPLAQAQQSPEAAALQAARADAAPYASMVARIGPPSAPSRSAVRGNARRDGNGLDTVLLLLAASLLLAEWASRRLRGAR